MKICAVWNPKGGQGKSTTSLNLAAAGSKMGLNVMLISQDVQDDESMKAFGEGKYPFTIVQGMPASKPDADLIIIDYPAGYRGKPECKTVICPVVPCRLDFKTYISAKPILDGCNLIEVVNRGDMRVAANREFALAMRKKGANVINRRSVFENAHNDMCTIFEDKYNKIKNISQSRAEIEAVLARVLAS